jgi:hypothetical protein
MKRPRGRSDRVGYHSLGSGSDSWIRGLIAVGLAMATMALLVQELNAPGVTWDEPQYFFSVERIQAWVGDFVSDPASAMQKETIHAAWDPDETRPWNPHPPVYKEGMAITESIFGRSLGSVAGYRVFPALLFSCLTGLLVWTVSGVAGIAAGLGSGLAWLVMPRVTGHALFGTTDMPLTFFWAAASLAFFSYLRSGGRSRFCFAALALGFAFGTKFTGWLLPVPLLVWTLLERRLLPWIGVVGVGLVVAYALVPSAWHDPLYETVRLFAESLARDRIIPINTAYLGRDYAYVVPWHHVIVMTCVTLPAGVLSLAIIGSIDCLRSRRLTRPGDDRAALARLSVLQIGFFFALLALPSSPNHDGIRLFLPLFPFVAVLTGLAIGRFNDCLRWRFDPRQATLGILVIGALYLLPGWWQTRHVSPYYLSYYNELIGGLPGAHRLGMETSYWYDAMTPGFLRAVESELPENAEVLSWPSRRYFLELQELGLLRSDLRFTDDLSSSYLLLLARQSTLSGPFEAVYRESRPVLSVLLDGVELAGLYEMRAPVLDGEPPEGE